MAPVEGRKLCAGSSVDAGHRLRNRVLHLQARVHLQEVKFALRRDHKLHRAGVEVAHRLRQPQGRRAHRVAQRGRHHGRRRLLDDLLVAPLDGAFPLEEMDEVAVVIAQHLDLHVAHRGEIFLHQDALVAEGGRRLLPRLLQGVAKLIRRPDDAHPLAAAAGAGLDQQRVAHLAGKIAQRIVGVLRSVHAGDDRHVRGHGDLPRPYLAAHGPDRLGARPDKVKAALRAGRGKGGVFAQEAVARMDGVRAGPFGHGKERLLVQVALPRRDAAERIALIRQARPRPVAVRFRVNGDGGNPQLPAGENDAHGDFAAIGYENFLKHNGPRSV